MTSVAMRHIAFMLAGAWALTLPAATLNAFADSSGTVKFLGQGDTVNTTVETSATKAIVNAAVQSHIVPVMNVSVSHAATDASANSWRTLFASLQFLSALSFIRRGTHYVFRPREAHQSRQIIVHALIACVSISVALGNVAKLYELQTVLGLPCRFASRALACVLLVQAMGYAAGRKSDTSPAVVLAALTWVLFGYAAVFTRTPTYWVLFVVAVLCGVFTAWQMRDMAMRSNTPGLREKSMTVANLAIVCGALYTSLWLLIETSSTYELCRVHGMQWLCVTSLPTILNGVLDFLFFCGCAHLTTNDKTLLDAALGSDEP